MIHVDVGHERGEGRSHGKAVRKLVGFAHEVTNIVLDAQVQIRKLCFGAHLHP